MALLRSGSYGHKILFVAPDDYELSWTTDTKPRDSRVRWPRRHRRYTNRKGAERFAKKWKVPMPQEKL